MAINFDNILLNHINSIYIICDIIGINIFAYIAINKYLFDKFYGIIIDTCKSKYFIFGHRQYIAYIKDIKNTTINIANVDTIFV